MKLYINYNFCGYRWFLINEVLQPSLPNSIKLDEWNGTDETLRIVKKLMLYDSYDAAFLHEDGKYILALRNIHEQNHKDPDGRKLSMAYIFEGTAKEKDLLEKVLLVYINHRGYLESVLSDLISAAVSHVDYNVHSLLELLATIKSTDKSHTILRLGTGRVLALFSKWRDDTISSNLGLKPAEFIKEKKSLEDYIDVNLIDNFIITDATKDLSNDNLLKIIAGTTVDPDRQFSIKQFLYDLKSLSTGQMSWKVFQNKYCSQLSFMCAGLIVGILIGFCF